MIVFSEGGLAGEVRSLTFTAEKLGFKKAIIPQRKRIFYLKI
jgi:predicted ATP-dependent serine protease